jgi:hypothetical protein
MFLVYILNIGPYAAMDQGLIKCVYTKKDFKIIHQFFFEVGIMGIPPLPYSGPKNQQHLILQGPIKIVIPYTQNDYMIINLKIII